MKRTAIVLFIISLIILLLSIGGFFLNNKPVESIRLYASVNVTDSAGFDLNSSALSFGNIVLGGSSIRNVIFENKHDFPVNVAISVEGDIKELLSYESPVIVESRETKKIPFSVVSSLSSERRDYSGSVIFQVFRDVR